MMMVGQAYGYYQPYVFYSFYNPQAMHAPLNYITDSSQKSAQAQYQSDANKVTESASDMLDAINRMTGPTYAAYNTVSSNSDAVKVTAAGTPGANTDIRLEVDRLATAQVNKGSVLNADGVYTGATGQQKFKIGIGGAEHEIAVGINAGETNEQVLRKVANAVNAKNIGVEAWINNDGGNNTSSLVFKSRQTGDKPGNHFTVSDSAGSSVVASTGINHKSISASDAVYTVNNTTHTSSSNNLELADGIKVSLQEETTAPVTISAQKDTSKAVKYATEFVNAFNQFLDDAESVLGGNNWLGEYLRQYSRNYASTFAKAGIMKNTDGSFSIDEKKLKEAAGNGSLEYVFTQSGGFNYGLAFKISHLAKSVEQNPSSYIKPRGNVGARYGTGSGYGEKTDYPSWIYDSYA